MATSGDSKGGSGLGEGHEMVADDSYRGETVRNSGRQAATERRLARVGTMGEKGDCSRERELDIG